MKRLFFWIFWAWILVYWGHAWESELKIDGMTYSVIARNMSDTGNWMVPSYTDYAYKEFYLHPPLCFWMQALVFKVFGATTITAKLLPSLFALLTFFFIAGFAWINAPPKLAALFAGLTAFVLLTSTRYVKFSSDFYLDGFLVVWLLIGAFSYLRFAESKKVSWGLASAFGALFALSLLTKGLVAFGLPICVLIFSVFDSGRRGFVRALGFLAIAAGVAGAILLPWLVFSNGIFYSKEYLRQSVSYRLGSLNLWDHFVPLWHLMKVYLPWWPLLIFSIVKLCKSKDPKHRGLLFFAFNGVAIVGAFSLVGHSIEHYFLPFYAFCAPAVAWGLLQFQWVQKSQKQIFQGAVGLLLIATIVLAVFPVRLHAKRSPELNRAIDLALERCDPNQIKGLWITEDVDYLWFSLATASWRTPWNVHLLKKPPEYPAQSMAENYLLITRISETTASTHFKTVDGRSFERIPGTMVNSNVRLYQPVFGSTRPCLN